MINNLGSLCIDNVYQVPYFVKPGETLPCLGHAVHPGGKGLNQSLALAAAGAEVRHVGRIGQDGVWLAELLADAGVDTSLIAIDQVPSGHANIQVTPDGENAIVLFGGANRTVGPQDLNRMLEVAQEEEFLLLQNEISHLAEVMQAASERGLRIVFNAAPMTTSVEDLPLQHVELFIVNEIEGEALTGQASPGDILDTMQEHFPQSRVLLTLGSEGAIYRDSELEVAAMPPRVDPVDTTGAGDTFTGYFLASYARNEPLAQSLEISCAAAALCVTRAGAANSIPDINEVQALLAKAN